VHNSRKDFFRKIYFLYDFWCAQTCSFRAAFGLPVCAIATCGKFFLYRCTSTFSALNCCGGIFFKSLSYLYEVVRTNFSADFWTFRNFWPQYRETSNKNENYVVYLKEQSIQKIMLKTASKSAYKRQRNACSNYAPLERTARRPRSVTKTNIAYIQ